MRANSEGYEVKNNNNYIIIALCALLYILIIGRAINNSMYYAFFAISLVVFFAVRIDIGIVLLAFILPFSTILKSSTDGMSCYTYLFFIVLLKTIFIRSRFSHKVFTSLGVLAIYLLVFSGIGQLTTIVTTIAGIVLLYQLNEINVDEKRLIMAFSTGLLFASILALFRESFPIINTFVMTTRIKLGEGVFTNRFSGLQGNPNYYTVDISVAVSFLVMLILKKRGSLSLHISLGLLVMFGILSTSKSFIVSVAALLVIWTFISFRHGASNIIKMFSILLILAVVVYYFEQDSINLYLFRFTSDKGSSFNTISTGRWDIWKAYLGSIIGNIKILVLGNGLNSVIADGRGAHNTYIEALFSLGLVGLAIYLHTLFCAFGKHVHFNLSVIPIIILLLRMLSINMLTYDNLWIYLIMIKTSMKCEYKEIESI